MSNLTHCFTAVIEDDYGRYPEALVVAYEIKKTTIEHRKSEGIDTEYKRDLYVSEFTYKASFYNSRDMLQVGKRSRPVPNPIEGMQDIEIEVDMNYQGVINAIDSGITGDELDNRIIEADIQRRNA